MKLIIDIPKEVYQHMMGNDLLKSVHGNICYKAVQNSTPILDNMTNGDMIKAMFPSIEVIDSEVMKTVYTGIPYGELIGANIDCMRDWWNAPYQKGGKE